MLSHAILPDLIVVIILFVTLTLFGLVIVELNLPRAITHIPTFLRGWQSVQDIAKTPHDG
jgi:hypothetical protein